MSDDKNILPFTGERFTPECVREIAYEHWHRYAWAKSLVEGYDVLDVACGEGYGSYLLSQVARSVIGVDRDGETISHARHRYQADQLTFIEADALSIPVADHCVDRVVCFETIEHLNDHHGLMTEIKRVLRPDGLLILSSPNKASYSDAEDHANPFHFKELYREELESLLGQHFNQYQLWAQKLAFASVAWPLTKGPSQPGESVEWAISGEEGIQTDQSPTYLPQYFLAIASAGDLGSIEKAQWSLYSDQEESVYAHYRDEIRFHMHIGEVLAQKEAEIERLRAEQSVNWWRRLMRLWRGESR